jgi:hypothetical protein
MSEQTGDGVSRAEDVRSKHKEFLAQRGQASRFAWAPPLLLAALLIGPGARPAGTILWKPATGAILKLNGRPVRKWNLYQAEKKGQFLLLQLGWRYLALDVKQEEVYEIPANSLKPKADGFTGQEPGSGMREIPSSDWTTRDIGPAELVRVKLGDYGQTVEIQVPHPPDLRAFY